ncbi:MAG TPA: methionine--tRNA ligase [Chitinophagales bacterium]|nr:methionine--tRNA ligase [Chitinophagales bacterium]
MSNPPKRYLVTAALPYANGGIHLGHLAGAYLPADTYVRYLRLRGRDVLFICGSDEHGVPITLGARKEGITPKAFVDKYHELMKSSFAEFGISFDIYSRTSNEVHHKTAQDFFTALYNKNEFIEEESEQYYDEQEKIFLADRYIVGTCPNCGNENAYGDQCEKCGNSLSPRELINPRSVVSGATPVLRKTKHWFFPLNKYEPWLREWILKEHKSDWKPNVVGQCGSWIENGLQPRAMTRDLDWGVPVPLKDAEGKVLYVWFDAPIGYISATKEYFEGIEKGELRIENRNAHLTKRYGLRTKDSWKDYWKSDDSALIHFIGKDNIVFHAIIFPSLLKAHGEFVVPTNVPANEFLNLEGDKLSTSRNWAVWLHDYLKEFPGKQDVLRYALTATAPESKDTDFTWKDFQARNNNELVAILGNLVNRAMVLTHKYFDGAVPPASQRLGDVEQKLFADARDAKKQIEDSIERFRFREALGFAMDIVRTGNKYLTDTEPWKVYKQEQQRTGEILNTCLQLIASIRTVIAPFLPDTADKIGKLLNMPEPMAWDKIGDDAVLQSGHKLAEATLLFAKIEDEDIQKQLDKLHSTKASQSEQSKTAAPVSPAGGGGNASRVYGGGQAQSKPSITFDDFTKMELRVGTIEAAEKVKNADKLLQLTVNLGSETRMIVSGIANHYAPEDVVGKQVCVVANLAPRKIKGIESKGMILMAEDADGKLRFITPSEKVASGSTIS